MQWSRWAGEVLQASIVWCNEHFSLLKAYADDHRGIFYFTGPVLLLLASVFEWVMGNFFSMIVMGMFAVFWLSFGVLETPAWGIAASYSVTGDVAQGEASIGYNAGVALYLIIWGFWLFTMFIFTLKTNVVTALIFLGAFTGCFIFSGSHWKVSTGDHEVAMRLQKVSTLGFLSLSATLM